MLHARPLRFIPAILLALALPAAPALGQQADGEACRETATTQRAMTACAIAELDAAELEMNTLYAIVLDKVRGDADTVRKIRAAQEAWRAFRQAHAAAIFPKADDTASAQAEYGSVFPMCWAGLNAELTQDRIVQLQEWVEGLEEGDVCAGSRGFAGN